jgi:DNA-3-methyladenine glycosylase II
MSCRIIESEADIAEGAAALAAACPHMRGVLDLTGQPPLRRRENGFAGLARIIVGQQLSVASASVIWDRFEKTVRPLEPETFLRKRDGTLRKCGLSAGKVATIRTIARAIAEADLDLATLAAAEEDAIREELTALKGVGPWTADIYVMFCLGRADGWAPGDLALRHAVAGATGREDIPDITEMAEIAEVWRPWRGVAARALWAWYGLRRAQGGADPV